MVAFETYVMLVRLKKFDTFRLIHRRL